MIVPFMVFLESNKNFLDISDSKVIQYKPTNLITEICVSMLLLNNEFLDNILDRGLKARYTENTEVFITDLKNLVLGKNRLTIGKIVDDKCEEDPNISKINSLFDHVDFNINRDWNVLINSRILSRNIIDKLLGDEKLTENKISKIYWLGPNKTTLRSEDIIIETKDGRQFSLFLNKNLGTQKTASFLKFADDLIGRNVENLFSEHYMNVWDKLIRNWVRVIYENSNKNIQIQIEKFIDPTRIDTLSWFDYFDLKHRDKKFQYLGEYIKDLDKNIIFLSDLLKEVWKRKSDFFSDPDKVNSDWVEKKRFLLNSKILEHIITESLLRDNVEEIKKLKSGFKRADGKIKMKIVKTLVEKLGSQEVTNYYFGNNGNAFYMVPSRDFFRKVYNDLGVKFDYHVKMNNDKGSEDEDFLIKIKLYLDGKKILSCGIVVGFTGGDVSSKLSAKYKFEIPDDFNWRIYQKMKEI